MSASTTPTKLLRPSRVVDARWQEWRGMWLLRKAQYHNLYQNEDIARSQHAQHLTDLLARGIPMRAIRANALDDPLADFEERDERIAAYQSRVLRYNQRRDAAAAATAAMTSDIRATRKEP